MFGYEGGSLAHRGEVSAGGVKESPGCCVGVAAGCVFGRAVGWVAGLVNALPRESVVLFELARRGDFANAWELYRWFLPLLRLDTKPEFVQLIKLVQQAVDLGSERVRTPRRPVEGALREETLKIVYERLSSRPRV